MVSAMDDDDGGLCQWNNVSKARQNGLKSLKLPLVLTQSSLGGDKTKGGDHLLCPRASKRRKTGVIPVLDVFAYPPNSNITTIPVKENFYEPMELECNDMDVESNIGTIPVIGNEAMDLECNEMDVESDTGDMMDVEDEKILEENV